MRYLIKSTTDSKYLGKFFTLDMISRTIDIEGVDEGPNIQNYEHIRGNGDFVVITTANYTLKGKLVK